MTKNPRADVAALAVLVLASIASAQPVNDNCANAIPVTNHSVTSLDMTGATRDVTYGNFTCNQSSSRLDVWYSYTAAGPENVAVTMCGSPTGTRRILTVFNGACGGPEVVCSENTICGASQPVVNFATPGAGTYLIAVSIRGTPSSLLGTLHVDASPIVVIPPNDTCATPQVLLGPGNYSFDSTNAATDGPPGSCNANGQPDTHDLYYSYTPSASGYFTVDTELSGPGVDTTLQVLDGCTGTELNCNDDVGSSLASRTCAIPATAGSTYIIRVASWGANSPGLTGTLRLQESGPPSTFVIPPGAISEPGGECDDHDQDVNYGCDALVSPDDERSTPISLCTTRQGHAPARFTPDAFGRVINDFDAYAFTLAAPATITVTGQTQFQAVCTLSSGCQQFSSYAVAYAGGGCAAHDFTMSAVLPAGTFRFGIGNHLDNSAVCGGQDAYWFTITTSGPCPAPCVADLGSAGGAPGSDGVLDNNDFIAFINYFFNGDAHADVGTSGGLAGHDGLYDNNDFIAFINAFFAGCP